MAVFRIDKTRDYTVMANHHLRNKALSLKAKGLLSLMLSLPEDWDYSPEPARSLAPAVRPSSTIWLITPTAASRPEFCRPILICLDIPR